MEFEAESLLDLAAQKISDQQFDQALSILKNSPSSTKAAQLRFSASYGLGKKMIAEGNYSSASEAFKECSENSTHMRLRPLAMERRRLLNKILEGAVLPITKQTHAYERAKIKPVTSLRPDLFSPTLWFVGSAAAYKSAYDSQWHDNLSRLIRRIKHDAEPGTLQKLGELLADFVFLSTPILARADLLVAVPTSRDRWHARGYQIPSTLGKVISDLCAIPIHDDAVETAGNVPELRNIPTWYRAKAIKGSYESGNSAWVEGQSLVIVDDVINTGSTVLEIARTLLGAGAKEVAAISLTHNERTIHE